MMTEFHPPIEMDLNGNPGRVTFRTFKEFKQWAEDDANAWSVVRDVRIEASPYLHRKVHDQVNSSIKILDLADALSKAEPGALRAIREQIENVELRGFADHGRLHHATPIGRHILSQLQSAPERAASCLIAFIDAGRNRRNRTVIFEDSDLFRGDFHLAIDGWIEKGLFERGWAPTPDQWRTLLDQLQIQFSDRLVELKKEAETANVDRVAWAHRLDEEFKSKQVALKDFCEERKREVSEAILQDRSELASVKKAYSEDIRIHASRNYWHGRKAEHLRSGHRLTAVFCILVAVAFAASVYAAVHAFDLVISHVKEFNSGLVAMLAVPLLLAYWPLRLLYRRLSAHFALAQDAAERVTMVETFLSLIKEGHLEERDRLLILTSLFRPSGSSTDDNLPVSILEALTQRIEKAKP